MQPITLLPMTVRPRAMLLTEPPDRVKFSWDVGPQWQIETDSDHTSEVEVRFIAETPRRTRLELEHRHIDQHGPGWQASAKVSARTPDGRCTWPGTRPCSPRRADGADHPCTDLNRPAGDVFAAADSTRLWESGRA